MLKGDILITPLIEAKLSETKSDAGFDLDWVRIQSSKMPFEIARVN
jgi:hypothetical protein